MAFAITLSRFLLRQWELMQEECQTVIQTSLNHRRASFLLSSIMRLTSRKLEELYHRGERR
jgi:hypothetical protein